MYIQVVRVVLQRANVIAKIQRNESEKVYLQKYFE